METLQSARSKRLESMCGLANGHLIVVIIFCHFRQGEHRRESREACNNRICVCVCICIPSSWFKKSFICVEFESDDPGSLTLLATEPSLSLVNTLDI